MNRGVLWLNAFCNRCRKVMVIILRYANKNEKGNTVQYETKPLQFRRLSKPYLGTSLAWAGVFLFLPRAKAPLNASG